MPSNCLHPKYNSAVLLFGKKGVEILVYKSYTYHSIGLISTERLIMGAQPSRRGEYVAVVAYTGQLGCLFFKADRIEQEFYERRVEICRLRNPRLAMFDSDKSILVIDGQKPYLFVQLDLEERKEKIIPFRKFQSEMRLNLDCKRWCNVLKDETESCVAVITPGLVNVCMNNGDVYSFMFGTNLRIKRCHNSWDDKSFFISLVGIGDLTKVAEQFLFPRGGLHLDLAIPDKTRSSEGNARDFVQNHGVLQICPFDGCAYLCIEDVYAANLGYHHEDYQIHDTKHLLYYGPFIIPKCDGFDKMHIRRTKYHHFPYNPSLAAYSDDGQFNAEYGPGEELFIRKFKDHYHFFEEPNNFKRPLLPDDDWATYDNDFKCFPFKISTISRCTCDYRNPKHLYWLKHVISSRISS